MAEGIFGLVGVMVGAIVTGAVEWWHARQARATARRAALRLVSDELEGTSVALRHAAQLESDDAVAEEVRDAVAREIVTTVTWREHRGELAQALGDSDWRKVSSAYQRVSLVVQNADQSPQSVTSFVREFVVSRDLFAALLALHPRDPQS